MNIDIIKKIPIELILLEFHNTIDSFDYKYTLNRFEMFVNEENLLKFKEELKATIADFDLNINQLDRFYANTHDPNVIIEKQQLISEKKLYYFKKTRLIKCIESFHNSLARLRKSEYDLLDKGFPITRENDKFLYIATKGQLLSIDHESKSVFVLYLKEKDKNKFTSIINNLEKI